MSKYLKLITVRKMWKVERLECDIDIIIPNKP